ncbi:DUF2141 domain-containing protein [Glycocaulis abyssi]|uniref:DUF2141 domain-containing protein n=1 Tax=Glycocaulis abyssi TaxID=1433403 RepID=A0ABV9NCZ3_9PROT
MWTILAKAAVQLAAAIAAGGLFTIPLAASLGGFDCASARETATLTVRLTGFSSIEGELDVAVYADADSWLGRDPAARTRIPAGTQPAELVFEGLAPSIYAVFAWHDENSDGRLNSGPMRIPTERFGYSAGARGRFGPASFDAAAITLESGMHHIEYIRLAGASGR